MRACKPLIAGLFLLASLPLSILPLGAQPIPADPNWQQPAAAPSVDGVGPDYHSGMTGYAGLRGSLAFAGNSVTTYAPTNPSTRLRASYATGGGGGIYFGERLPFNLRVELEAMYRFQPLSQVSLNGTSAGTVYGNSQQVTPMMNLLWDLPVPDELIVQPFVGMGVGADWTHTAAINTSGTTFLHQDRWDLAYQMLAGLALPMSDSSRVTAMYRWMQLPDAGHKCAVSGTVQGVCLSNSVNSSSLDFGYELDL